MDQRGKHSQYRYLGQPKRGSRAVRIIVGMGLVVVIVIAIAVLVALVTRPG